MTAAWKRGHDFWVLDGDAEPVDAVRRRGPPLGRNVDGTGPGDLRQAEGRAVRRRQLPRHALVAQQIRPVGRDIHDQTGVAQRDRLEQRSARRRHRVELEDAVVLLAQAELPRGAEHALADHAADRPRLDPESLGAGHLGAEPGERVALPRGHVRRAADHGERRAGAIVHAGETHLRGLGIRVRADLEHARHDERRELGVERFDGVHRRAQHGEPSGDVGGIELPAEEGLEPAQGDVHASPPVSPGRPTDSRNRMSPPSSRRMSGTP